MARMTANHEGRVTTLRIPQSCSLAITAKPIGNTGRTRRTRRLAITIMLRLANQRGPLLVVKARRGAMISPRAIRANTPRKVAMRRDSSCAISPAPVADSKGCHFRLSRPSSALSRWSDQEFLECRYGLCKAVFDFGEVQRCVCQILFHCHSFKQIGGFSQLR